MCDSYGDTRNWRLYIEGMIKFGEWVVSFTEGLNREAFVADRRTSDATLRNTEMIG